MNFEFLEDLSEGTEWKVLKNELLSGHIRNYKKSYSSLDSYQLVHVLVGDHDAPVRYRSHSEEPESYMIFTNPSLLARLEKETDIESIESHSIDRGYEATKLKLKSMMLGELVDSLKDQNEVSSIKVNPVLTRLAGSDTSFVLCEDVLFAPMFDKFTSKLLLTDPADAKALLAIDERDVKRFGIELRFYMITNRSFAPEGDDRNEDIKSKIEELAFIAPRVPMKKGSGTFLLVILNLENEIEEQAFIRDYKMFDEYSNVLFVTSSLKLLTGQLDRIHYNGDSIDTIFHPMIEWQKNLL